MIDPMDMTENAVLEILKNKEKLCKQKQLQISEIQQELLHIERLAETAVLAEGGMGEIHVKSNHTGDLTNVLMDVYRREDDMRKALLAEYQMAADVVEAIRRVWICFRVLPGQEYDILYRLYVKQELWEVLEREYSHRKICELRKKGLEKILQLYSSTYTNSQIAKREFLRNKEE